MRTTGPTSRRRHTRAVTSSTTATSSRASPSNWGTTIHRARNRSRPMSPELDAPVVLITGATGPLGRVVARRFARDGARLALVGRDHARLAEFGEGLGVGSDRWLAVPGELIDADSADAVAGAVAGPWGRVGRPPP